MVELTSGCGVPNGGLQLLLQRGHGRGVCLARTMGAAAVRGALRECLRYDPRWHEIEDRSLYYVDVAAMCEFEASAVQCVLREVSNQAEELHVGASAVVAEMLAVMAVRGDGAALNALRAEVVEGRAWEAAAEHLAARLPTCDWIDLGSRLFERLSDEELGEFAACSQDEEPWVSWSEAVWRYREAYLEIHRARPSRCASGAERLARRLLTMEGSATSAELSRAREVASSGSQLEQTLAYRALARFGDADLLGRAAEHVRPNTPVGLRMALTTYICAAPPTLTLPLARHWMRDSGMLREVAKRVLARWAERQDELLLRSVLVASLEESDPVDGHLAAEGLGRFAAAETLRELRVLYNETPSSRARSMAARALVRADPDFGTTAAIECLYDCESETRLLGIELADRSIEGVEDRILAMADDPAEVPACRAAALRTR